MQTLLWRRIVGSLVTSPRCGMRRRVFTTQSSWESDFLPFLSRITQNKSAAGPAQFERFKEIAAKLAPPPNDVQYVHIAGSKGKGSTAAFVEAILRSHAGRSTFLYSSPHLVDVRERFQFDRQLATPSQLTDAFARIRSRDREGVLESMLFFEVLTLIAFELLAANPKRAAVIEVGLGGRLDPTNAIPTPRVCAITSLALEHTAILGSTLPQIASEKAGIIKPGTVCVCAPQEPAALSVLLQRARAVGAPLLLAPELSQLVRTPITLGLPGQHQRQNAAVALLCALLFEKRGQAALEHALAELADLQRDLPADTLVGAADRLLRAQEHVLRALLPPALPPACRHALATCAWPGRGQVVRCGRITLFLDGAHTLESVALCRQWFAAASAADAPPGATVARVLVFTCRPDKDPARLLRPLMTERFDRVVLCGLHDARSTLVGRQRPVDAHPCDWPVQRERLQTLAALWNVAPSPIILHSAEAVLDWLQRMAGEDDGPIHVLVTGSLHLVGNMLQAAQQPPA